MDKLCTVAVFCRITGKAFREGKKIDLSSYVLPVFFALVILWGVINKVKVFDAFSEGAKQGFEMFVNLLPVLTGLIAAITLMNSSGAIAIVGKLLSPVASLLGIPDEIIPLCVLSPVSGSGSLSMYESILTEYGPDSAVGRIASVIAASTETTFYAVTVYLGSLGIKKTGAVIPCALVGDLVSFIAAAITVRIFFG